MLEEERTRSRPSARIVHYSQVSISVAEGPDRGLTLRVAGTVVRVGTARDNHLVLSDNTVSRHHCELRVGEHGTRIRDQGSTNGVVIGEVKVLDGVVALPARLRLGETVLSIEALDETVAREQATNDSFGDLLGSSAAMRELFADLARIAPTDVTLLVEGETGTGKELVAESVHRMSPRADGPFVVFDCSAVAPTLVESELFGHERGAFTGAVQARAGLFELAQGGTVFLDELGELEKSLQPKLLRVLEKREVRRIGSTRSVPVDVRLVSATNRDLGREVAQGNFREDLYFRVSTAHVVVPPLRDRLEDLPMLVEHLFREVEPRRSAADVPAHVWDMFRAHRWPGNVRELKNAVQRLLVTPERPLRALRAEPGAEPPVRSGAPSPLRVARREAADAFERDYLRALLDHTQGNVTRAAALAEVSRQMIQKLARRHGV
jgi:transcriptional regulator with PAS, ATPase and Fis domain